MEITLTLISTVGIRTHYNFGSKLKIFFQVWDVAFEPNIDDPSQTTKNFAVCGGSVVSIYDAETAKRIFPKKIESLGVR